METTITYDDVLIKPKFSHVRSRRDVNLHTNFLNKMLKVPVVSANMDTITGSVMANKLLELGADAALHRFCTIEDNVKMFKESAGMPLVSIGVGNNEFERALELFNAGAHRILIDVAHGASIQVVEQYDRLREKLGTSIQIAVGNFDNYESIQEFLSYSKAGIKPNAFKIGIGSGSVCHTSTVTGCGGGIVTAISDCSLSGVPLIADGGIRTSGDIAKALAAGASMVMLGKMLAGTLEANSLEVDSMSNPISTISSERRYKIYRGSASKESYEVQGKISEWRTPEGESSLVPSKGPVENVIQQIDAGLRSAFSYVGAFNIAEFKEKAKLVRVTNTNGKVSSV